MKASLSILLTAIVLSAEQASVEAWIPSARPSAQTESTLLRSGGTNHNEASQGDASAPEPPAVRVEEPMPKIQPIQPGMHEPPMYVDPPASMSIQPADTSLHSNRYDNDRQVPLNTFNGRTLTSTSNLIDANKPLGYGGSDQERIQGDSLRTYDNPMGGSSDTSVDLKTQGRPIHADLQMWAGPNNVPKSVRLYSQDGSQYGIGTTFTASNSQQPNSVSIRNQANMEFPLTARVTSASPANPTQTPSGTFQNQSQAQSASQVPRAIEHEGGVLIQGEGMVKTFPIAANMQKVQIILQSSPMTGSRRLPIMAKVELLQGPNNVKTSAEIYDDGMHGDYFETVFDTPGFSSSIRITNTGPMTYPFHVLVLPHTFGDPKPLANDVNDVTNSRFGPDGRFRG